MAASVDRKRTQKILKLVRGVIYRIIDRTHLSNNAFTIIISLVIGLLVGFASIFFRWLIDYIQFLYTGTTIDHVQWLMAIPLWLKIVVATGGGFIVGSIIHFFAHEAVGAGVPEVMEAVAIGGGKIRPRITIVKSVCAAMTIGFGGSVGREGPIIHIGSAIGSTVGQFLGLSESRLKIMIGCGAASGIAATFNTPIAGVIFAIEIILGSYALSTLTPLILSSVFSTMISRMYLGDYPFIRVPSYAMVSWYEVISYSCLGTICAVLAVFFIVSIYTLSGYAARVRIFPPVKTAVGMACAGFILHFAPQIYGMGYDSMKLALNGQLALNIMIMLVMAKIVATSLTLGGGASGGIFAPSLFIGALTGGAFGQIVHSFWPNFTSPSGAYALAGMAAFVSGTTHGPITAIIMLFELTGDYKIVLPLMISCMIASQLASTLKKESIYTEKLRRRGVVIDRGIETTIMGSLRCYDVMRQDIPTVQFDTPSDILTKKVLDSHYHQVYVIDTDGVYHGTVNLDIIRRGGAAEEGNPSITAHDLMEFVAPIDDKMPLTDIIGKFGIFDLEEFPVVDLDGHLIGRVSHQDIFKVYTLEILKKEPTSIRFLHRGPDDCMHSDFVELPDNYQIIEVPVPPDMAHKTLRSLDLRARFGVSVLAIKTIYKDDRMERDMPDPDFVLKKYHRLVIVGKNENIARFKQTFHCLD